MKLFIFDCDGTIIDSQHTIVDGMEHAFSSLGFEGPGAEASRSIIGLSLGPAIYKLAPHLDEDVRDQVVEAYKDYVIAQRANGEVSEPLYDGAKQVIEGLAGQEDILLGIATGKAYRGVLHLFDSYGWHDHFVTVQTADRAPSKPHPGMILQAMSETGVDASQTVMIGDTSYDMQMAVAAGVRAIGVTWGYHSEAILREAGAHHLVEDYAALKALLDGLD